MTLTEFLLARIAEDEALARGAIRNGEGSLDWADDGDPTDAHIARWDPARILAECEAKRAIVKLHSEIGLGNICPMCGTWEDYNAVPVLYPCPTLRLLASVYADHEDYRQDWKL